VLFFGNRAGNEDAEMARRRVNGIDDCLSMRADVIYTFIKIKNPVQRLRGRGNVVGLRTENHNGCPNVAQVYGRAIGRNDLGCCELVANE